jgi:hypothetical membrane protein
VQKRYNVIATLLVITVMLALAGLTIVSANLKPWLYGLFPENYLWVTVVTFLPVIFVLIAIIFVVISIRREIKRENHT